jgi:hypothetical protein
MRCEVVGDRLAIGSQRRSKVGFRHPTGGGDLRSEVPRQHALIELHRAVVGPHPSCTRMWSRSDSRYTNSATRSPSIDQATPGSGRGGRMAG